MDELSIEFVTPPNLDLIEVVEHLLTANSVTAALAGLNVKSAVDNSPTNSKQISLIVALTYAGEKVQLELQPQAIPMLMLEMFSVGGWESISSCKTEILQAAFMNANSPELRQEVIKNLYSGSDFVINVVRQIVIEIFEEINLLSKYQINKKLIGIASDKIRYGYPDKPKQVSGGTTGGSGSNVKAIKMDDLSGTLNINYDAKLLIREIRTLAEAYKIYRYEINLRQDAANKDFPEGRYGTPLPDDLFKIQEEAFLQLISEAVSPPNLHTIAPYIMAQIWQQSLSDEEILRLAFEHLRDTKNSLDQEIAKEDQTDSFKSAMNVSVEPRAKEASVITELYSDSITTRAMMWARNHMLRDYQYEPLADELLLIQLLGIFQKKLENEEADDEIIKTILLIKTLASLMESIDFIEEIEQKEALKAGGHPLMSSLNDLSIVSSIGIGVLTFLAPEVALLAAARSALSQVFLALMLGSYLNVINEISLKQELLGRQLTKQFITSQNNPTPTEMHDIASLIAQKPSYIYALIAHTANIAVSLVLIKGLEKGVSYLGLKGLSKIKGVPLSTEDVVKVNRKLSILFGLALDTYFLNEASE